MIYSRAVLYKAARFYLENQNEIGCPVSFFR